MILILLLSVMALPVSAMEFNAPSAPEAARPYMPDENETFAQGLWYIIKTSLSALRPEVAKGLSTCLALIAAVLLLSILSPLSERASESIRLVGAVVIGLLLLEPANSMISLGMEAVMQISDYSKLLIPVMTAALAAQGGTTASAALYAGTVFFNTILTTVIVKLIVPAVYIYLCLSIACCAVSQDMLKGLQGSVKWAMTWSLKWVLYIFTGYMSITGVISGTVDASALKAAKLSISGMVPVVGGILSDASEAILVSAGLMKSAAGVYGIFAVLSVCVAPFIQIGALYLLLKLSAGICNVFGYKPASELIGDFSTAMGFVLAMTGTVCMLLLISIVCFMKGMG